MDKPDVKNMKAQISLEFMIVVAIYLAFLSILIYTQNQIIFVLKEKSMITQNSIDAESINIIFSLGKIYTSTKDGSDLYNFHSDCIVIGGVIYCGKNNDIIKEKIYVDEKYDQVLD